MSIVNINYQGRVVDPHFIFSPTSSHPLQQIIKTSKCTLIIFQSKKCRLMGCKEQISTLNDFPYRIIIDKIQSATAILTLNKSINLMKLSQKARCIYEKELFPALRLTNFNPICVNVFSSGKIVIAGLKSLNTTGIIIKIKDEIYNE